MRYVATALLVLGLGFTGMAPVAFAQVNVPPNSSFANQYGNQVGPLEPGGSSGGCSMDGVAYSCTQPASMTLPTPSGWGGGVAGGNTVCPVIGPCYEPQYSPFSGGDGN